MWVCSAACSNGWRAAGSAVAGRWLGKVQEGVCVAVAVEVWV